MSTKLGQASEKRAVEYLNAEGFFCIQTNYRGHRLGEIDIIGLDGDVLCFIEVKFRKNNSYGEPVDFVTPAKCNKIILTAQHYLCANEIYLNYECRFDVVNILGDQIEWIKNAFELEG